jgi:2-polyprenyl-6-hydroxyphenyl methylase/3-demethylubiquinone-9 3-methyltransferase
MDMDEVAKFSALGTEWWNPDGKLAPLHRLNPLRLRFIRDAATSHFRRGSRAIAPFSGLSLLDVGCGGGVLSEPLAKQGFSVLGIDAAEENVEIAAMHARDAGVAAHYRHAVPETLAAEGRLFDVVLSMEVLEHVANPADFVGSCAALLKPGGLLFAATINRTLKSLALAKIAAEYLLRWVPAGTHDWDKFISPEDLRAYLEDNGLAVADIRGVAFDPLGWNWHLSDDISVNYMIVASATAIAR